MGIEARQARPFDVVLVPQPPRHGHEISRTEYAEKHPETNNWKV
jgi:hypothetical protein